MTVPIYQAIIPYFVRSLTNFSAILDQAISFCKTQNMDQSLLVNSRLAPDMYSFARQSQIAFDAAKICAAKLSRRKTPELANDESTFTELKERISQTIAFISSIPKDEFEGCETRIIHLRFPNMECDLNGRDYVFGFVLPNFYFHLSMGYAILRHQGLNLSIIDFLGNP